ncbi:UNVERIFIED_CONTAM: hypothetical protein RMT77_007151 [Armadillidium vulgare]
MSLFPNSTILLHCLRIFGQFPYVWIPANEITNEDVSSSFELKDRTSHKKIVQNERQVFVPSKLWKIWSVVICFVIILLILYDATRADYLSKAKSFGITAVRQAYVIYDSLQYTSLLLMNIFSFKNSHKLYKILNSLGTFLSVTSNDKKKQWKTEFSWKFLYVELICIVTVVVISVGDNSCFRSIYHHCFYMFIIALNLLLVSTYSSLFLGILTTVGSLYEIVFYDLTTYTGKIEERYCNSPLQISIDQNQDKRVFITVSSSSYNSWDERKNLNEYDQTENILRNKITIDSIRKCKISLLQLNAFKRLIVDYFEVLIIVFMIALISTTVIAMFYFSVLNESLLQLLNPICYSISTIVPLLCLLNAPFKINKQIERARHSVKIARYSERNMNILNEEVKTKLH